MTPEELYACYVANHRRLYLVALAITMDRQMAEDAVHDTLEKLLRQPRRPVDPLRYVTRAVRNTAIDLSRRRRFDPLPTDDLLIASDGESCEISPATLAAAFSRLSRDETEVIWLHVYADLPFREIAELRERSINTVTSWYRRGIDKLQAILDSKHESN